jgi:hypothetical protein
MCMNEDEIEDEIDKVMFIRILGEWRLRGWNY